MERLSATLKWREEFNIEGLLNETFPDEVFGKVGYIYGRDKEGRSITYVFAPRFFLLRSSLTPQLPTAIMCTEET